MHLPLIFLDNPLSPDEEGNYLAELPIIFTPSFLGETVPAGFNAVSISLHGEIDSNLNWQKEADAAKHYCFQGIKIFWQIELGLFSNLKFPLSDSTQLLALGLALKHFQDTLWQEFQGDTLGLAFYHGDIDFTRHLTWNATQIQTLQGWLQDRFHNEETLSEELGVAISHFNQMDHYTLKSCSVGMDLLKLFCCDVAMEYINLLSERLPGNLTPSILLHTQAISNPLLLAQLLAKERYPRTHRVVTNDPWKIDFHGSISKEIPIKAISHAKVGICLPSVQKCYPSYCQILQQVWNDLISQGKEVRPISEATLSTDWEGLDSIVVLSDVLSIEGYRKLRGFCASGGTVISVGKALQLPYEIPYGANIVKKSKP